MPPSSSSASNEDAANRETPSGLFSGLRIVSLCTLLSRVLGLIRDVGMAALFGLTPIADHFVVAFSIPNLARRLFGEGALSSAFLPVLTRELSDRESAWRLVSAVLTLLTITLCGLVVLAEIVLWACGHLFALSEDASILLGLTAVMLPYLIVICVAAQISAVLHALEHFTWPALVPVVLNICWIAGIGFVNRFVEDPVSQAYALAAVIVFAGLLQIAVQWPVLRRFGFHFRTDWQSVVPQVKQIVRAMLPVMIGLSTVLLNTLADRLIAWGFSQTPGGPLLPGTAAALYYAQRLYQFPLGVFGIALGTVLFPLLARHAAERRTDLLRSDLTLGLRLVAVIGLPASVGLLLLSGPLARTLFEHGKFTAADSTATAGLIAAYGLGVWAFCGQLILTRAFYAMGDFTAPLRIGIAGVALNLLLDLTLIWPFAGPGLAYATVAAAVLQVVLLGAMIQSRCGRLDWRTLGSTTIRAAIATAAMSAACLWARSWFEATDAFSGRLAELLIPFGVSIAVYLIAARLLRLEEVGMLLRRDGRKRQ